MDYFYQFWDYMTRKQEHYLDVCLDSLVDLQTLKIPKKILL